MATSKIPSILPILHQHTNISSLFPVKTEMNGVVITAYLCERYFIDFSIYIPQTLTIAEGTYLTDSIPSEYIPLMGDRAYITCGKGQGTFTILIRANGVQVWTNPTGLTGSGMGHIFYRRNI